MNMDLLTSEESVILVKTVKRTGDLNVVPFTVHRYNYDHCYIKQWVWLLEQQNFLQL